MTVYCIQHRNQTQFIHVLSLPWINPISHFLYPSCEAPCFKNQCTLVANHRVGKIILLRSLPVLRTTVLCGDVHGRHETCMSCASGADNFFHSVHDSQNANRVWMPQCQWHDKTKETVFWFDKAKARSQLWQFHR